MPAQLAHRPGAGRLLSGAALLLATSSASAAGLARYEAPAGCPAREQLALPADDAAGPPSLELLVRAQAPGFRATVVIHDGPGREPHPGAGLLRPLPAGRPAVLPARSPGLSARLRRPEPSAGPGTGGDLLVSLSVFLRNFHIPCASPLTSPDRLAPRRLRPPCPLRGQPRGRAGGPWRSCWPWAAVTLSWVTCRPPLASLAPRGWPVYPELPDKARPVLPAAPARAAPGHPEPPDAAVVHDPVRNELVLFGNEPLSGALGDTWTLSLADLQWTQRCAGCGVPPWKLGMARDAARDRIVLVSRSSTSVTSVSTSEWDGTSWARVCGEGAEPCAPGVVQAGSMAYDAARGVSVLVVFTSATGPQTWEYDGAQPVAARWQQRSAPPEGLSGELRYDEARQRVTMAASKNSLEWDGDCWYYAHDPADALDASLAGLAHDPASNRTLAVGYSQTYGYFLATRADL